jgi:hypothetical protein
MKNLTSIVCLLSFLIPISIAAAKKTTTPPKEPPRLRYQDSDDTFRYTVNIQPANPKPGETVSVFFELTQIMEKPSAIYGKFKPINDAEISAILVGPVSVKKKRKKGKAIVHRIGQKLSDTGIYGFTFTATKAGFYGIHFKGNAPEAGAVKYSIPLGYDLWPLPDEAQAPAISGRTPRGTATDLAHGKALCAKYCKKDLPGAKMQDDVPVVIDTEFALGLSEPDLMGKVLNPDARGLSELEQTNLLSYLHTLYVPIREFFPKAQSFTYSSFTINNYGLKRLRKSAKLKLDEKEATGQVFIVFGGTTKASTPNLIDYDDRIAREKLKPSDKLGYLIFFKMGKKSTEVGMALKKEPNYKIANLRSTSLNKTLNRNLRSFIGKGRFNDPGSIRGGSSSVRAELVPMYLKAAELATMYYSDEREFTAFDSEFSDADFE